ncbi:MAG: helix-turn-helix domain-containing protein [Thaumarchaeota archaeon]|nr:helix-turn-helix domain-containing protein [Nitrososphaerota archaeon]
MIVQSILLILLMQANAQAASTYSAESLLFRSYADGRIDVIYEVTVDTSLATVEIPLFGSLYENLLILNEQGLPLDYSTTTDGVRVDSLGSWRLRITYSISDLTSKLGRVWTIAVTSPIEFTIVLPQDSTIVGLSASPTSISSIDGRHVITLPLGSQEVSYMIGVVGTREQAQILIEEAADVIRQASSEGVQVAEAEAMLERAKQEFENQRYAEAELIAREAKQLVEKTQPPPLHTSPTDPLAFVSTQPWSIPAILIGIVAVVLALRIRKRNKQGVEVTKTFRQINLDKILAAHTDLRVDDREALEFIAQAGGEVLETELREKFKLPRSTAWRMIKRLQRQGLVEIRKIGGQNLISITDVS